MPKSRLVYILLALFLGGFGVHNFFAGHTKRAIAQLLTNIGLMILDVISLGATSFLHLGLLVWIIIDICTIKKDAQGVDFN